MRKAFVSIGCDCINRVEWIERYGPFKTQKLAFAWLDELWEKLQKAGPFEGMVFRVDELSDPSCVEVATMDRINVR